MAEINLNLNKGLFVPKFYPYLSDYSHRWEVYMGSAGSAKSYFITQKLILKALKYKIRILVCRKTATTIRQTVFDVFKKILTKFELIQYCKVNESDFRIKLPNGSEILFMGLDEETKLLSLSDINTVFIEEVYEVSKNIVEQLNLRVRGDTQYQQIIMAFNPISSYSWLYDFCEINPPSNFLYLHSTYKDNPFLQADYIEQLEDLYRTNPQKANIFCDGKWGVNVDGLVFTNWTIENFDVMELASKGYEHRVGCDLGYIDPTTIVCSLYDKENKTIYVYDEFYKSGCQLDSVYEEIIKMELTKVKIYMDSAEPRTIDYFKSKGIRAVPCIKGAGSVNSRISFLQNSRIIINPNCTNVIKEFENFCYIKDKQTDTYTDKTTHEFSHAIDGLSYAYSDIYKNNKLKLMDKSAFGF